MLAYNVYLDGKCIDTVFFDTESGTIKERCESVKRSLINHDGYDPCIDVKWPKGQRVTVDAWELQADYGYGDGYETISAGATRREVKQNLKEYRENGDYAPMKIVYKRERL